MQITTNFTLKDSVRVVKDGNFVGTVIGVHVDWTIHDDVEKRDVSYDVTLPPDQQGHGRNKTTYWRYREDWLAQKDESL